MNGDILYRLRDALDLNEKDFGEMLGLTGDNVKETIRQMEKGIKTISGPLKELIPRVAREHGYELVNGSTHWTPIRKGENR